MQNSTLTIFERNESFTLSVYNSSGLNETDFVSVASPNSSPTIRNSPLTIVLRVFLLCSAFVGSLANATVLCVLLSSKSTRGGTANLFIINQTILDMLGCILMVIFAILGLSTGVNNLSPIVCLLFGGGFMTSSCVNASAMSLFVITVERYMKIVRPVYHRNHYRRWMTHVAIPLCWILGFSNGIVADFITGRNCLSIPIRFGKVCTVESHFNEPTIPKSMPMANLVRQRRNHDSKVEGDQISKVEGDQISASA